MKVMLDMKKDIIDHVDEIRIDINTQITVVKEKVDNVCQRVSELEESVLFAQNEITDNRKKLDDMQGKILKLEGELSSLRDQFNSMSAKEKENKEAINILERYSREFNFRIGMVDEQVNESSLELVADLIFDNKVLVDFSKEDILQNIENAHRVGKKVSGKSRHIIVKMYSRPVRNRVVALVKKNKSLKFWVMDDLTKTDYQLKRSARKMMDKAYKEKKKTRFWRGKLYIDNKEVKITL